MEDAKIYLGFPPYDDENKITNNEEFLVDCERFWGKEAFNDTCNQLRGES